MPSVQTVAAKGELDPRPGGASSYALDAAADEESCGRSAFVSLEGEPVSGSGMG